MMINHQVQRLNFEFIFIFSKVDDEHRETTGFVVKFIVRRGAREQKHQIGLEHPGDEDLLAIDEILVAFTNSGGLKLGRLRSGVGFRNAEGLQA